MTVTDPIGHPTTETSDSADSRAGDVEELGLRIFDLTAEPWMSSAACRGLDPALFFPERGDGAATVRAKAVCARCPVLDDCARYAATIRNPAPGVALAGVWAGMSEQDRRGVPVERAATNRRQLRPSRPDLDYLPATNDHEPPTGHPIAVGTIPGPPGRLRWPNPDYASPDGCWPRYTWQDSPSFAPPA